MVTDYNVTARSSWRRLNRSDRRARRAFFKKKKITSAVPAFSAVSQALRRDLVAEVAEGRVVLRFAARLDEDRVVAGIAQRQPQHPERLQPELAVGMRRTEVVERRAAGAGDELLDAERIAAAGGVLRREALVEVIVAGDRDVDAELVHQAPHVAHPRARAAARAGGEERVMPQGQRAARSRRRGRLQILSQPHVLLLALRDPHLAVERDDVPVAEREAVEAGAARAGAIAEVVEIGKRARRLVFVVARRGERARLVTAPPRVVAVLEIRRRRVEVDVVAGR